MMKSQAIKADVYLLPDHTTPIGVFSPETITWALNDLQLGGMFQLNAVNKTPGGTMTATDTVSIDITPILDNRSRSSAQDLHYSSEVNMMTGKRTVKLEPNIFWKNINQSLINGPTWENADKLKVTLISAKVGVDDIVVEVEIAVDQCGFHQTKFEYEVMPGAMDPFLNGMDMKYHFKIQAINSGTGATPVHTTDGTKLFPDTQWQLSAQ